MQQTIEEIGLPMGRLGSAEADAGRTRRKVLVVSE